LNELRERLARLLDLVRKEDEHLQAVRQRLLGDDCGVPAERAQQLLATDLGIDRLESFGAKFGRMQDTLVDKLIPTLLLAAGEQTGAAIDNLGRMERLGLVHSVDSWLQMRRLRNRLVHEYIDRPDDLASALERACQFTHRMHADFEAMHAYAQEHLLNP
jgi:hypothetical protein